MAPRNVFEQNASTPHSPGTKWRSRHADPLELEALHEGVPEWMQRPLAQWLMAVTRKRVLDEWANWVHVPDVDLLQEYEIATRSRQSLIATFKDKDIPGLWAALGTDGILDFVDFLLFKQGKRGYEGEGSIKALEKILTDSGSAWTVGERNDHVSLEKRVPEGVATAVAGIVTLGSTAGELLAEAWHAAFGRSPDPEEAYEKAIKAVEAAGAALVAPKNAKATLGTMIRDMKAQGDWKLPLPTSVEPLLPMAEALWTGQASRHGGGAYRKPSQGEAESAVLLAVALVQFFSSGAAARR